MQRQTPGTVVTQQKSVIISIRLTEALQHVSTSRDKARDTALALGVRKFSGTLLWSAPLGWTSARNKVIQNIPAALSPYISLLSRHISVRKKSLCGGLSHFIFCRLHCVWNAQLHCTVRISSHGKFGLLSLRKASCESHAIQSMMQAGRFSLSIT